MTAVAGRLPVPAIRCPFGNRISPHADAADLHSVRWAVRWGLPDGEAEAERLAATRVGRLAARTAPEASPEVVELLADWQTWLFLFDDRYCDESPHGADLTRLTRAVTAFTLVLDGAAGPAGRDGPFTRALGDLMDRLAGLATGQQVSRFVSAVRGYFLAQFWEADHRAEGAPAGLAEYRHMRRHSGAVPTCMALIDLAGGYELPGGDYCRADVRAVTDIAVNVTCWANDILSYPKEAARSVAVHSLPAVLAREHGLPVTQALRAAAAMHDAEVDRYLAAEARVRRGAGPGLRRYLDGLRAWMGGNYHWSLETGRYVFPGEPDADEAEAV